MILKSDAFAYVDGHSQWKTVPQGFVLIVGDILLLEARLRINQFAQYVSTQENWTTQQKAALVFNLWADSGNLIAGKKASFQERKQMKDKVDMRIGVNCESCGRALVFEPQIDKEGNLLMLVCTCTECSPIQHDYIRVVD